VSASPAGTTSPPATAPRPIEVSSEHRAAQGLPAEQTREPAAQPRHPHGRDHPDPPPAQPGARLLRQETGRGQDRQRGPTLAEAAGQQRHPRLPAGRRPAGRGPRQGPGRATGERLCRQRGRIAPQAPALRTSHSRPGHHPTTAASNAAPSPAVPAAGLAIPRSLPPRRRRSRRSRRSARSAARTNDLKTPQDDGHTRPRGRPGVKDHCQHHSARRALHRPRRTPAQPLTQRGFRYGRFGRGGVLRSRPLVTGDSVAASPRAQPLPICGAGRITARSRPGVAAGLVTLALAARDQRLRNRRSAALSWRLLKGRETGGTPKGNRNPGNGRRGRTGERRTRETGEGGRRGRTRRANGKPEESPRGEPEDVR
jgi:hypothetical protein